MGISSKNGVSRMEMELEQRVSQLEKDVKLMDDRLNKVEEGHQRLESKLDRIDLKLDTNQSQLMATIGQLIGFKQVSVTSQAEVSKTKWTTIGAIATAALAGGSGLTLFVLGLLERL